MTSDTRTDEGGAELAAAITVQWKAERVSRTTIVIGEGRIVVRPVQNAGTLIVGKLGLAKLRIQPEGNANLLESTETLAGLAKAAHLARVVLTKDADRFLPCFVRWLTATFGAPPVPGEALLLMHDLKVMVPRDELLNLVWLDCLNTFGSAHTLLLMPLPELPPSFLKPTMEFRGVHVAPWQNVAVIMIARQGTRLI